jgi:WD40 repeat protein
LEAAREKQQTAEHYAREQRRLNRRLRALVAVATVIAIAAAAGAVGIYRESQKAKAEKKFSQAAAMLAGDVDGSDIQAFHELLDAYGSVHHDGPLINALRARSSTIRISDAHEPVVGVAFSAPSHRLAVATADNHIRLWHTSTPVWREHPLDDAQTLTSPSQGQGAYSSIAISPDGNLLAGGRSDGKVELWNLDGPNPQSRPIDVLQHEGMVTSVAFSPDGQRIASAGGADRVVDISNTAGEQGKRIPTGSEVFTVAFDPRSDLLASGGSDGDIRFWNPDGSPGQTIPHAHANGVMTLAFNPNEPVIASGGADHMVRLWHADSLTQFDHPLSRHTETVEGVAFNAEGTKIASASADHTVQLWDAERREPIGDSMKGHTEIAWAAAFVGNRIVSGSNDQTIRVWDGDVGQPVSSPLRGHQDAVTGVAINNAGDRVASASADKTVRLWDLHTGKEIAPPFIGHTAVVTSVAFSPNGERIASGSADGTVRLWRTDTHALIATLDTKQPVHSVAFSPDGDRLVSAGGDCHVTLWDIASEKPTLLLCNDRSAVLAVAFNPRGDRLASGGVDGKLRLWDPVTAHQLWERDALLALSDQTRTRLDLASGRPAIITSVAFSPDGTRIASGSSSWRPVDQSAGGIIQRWDAATGRPAGEPMHPPVGSVTAVAYSPQVAGKEASRIVSGDSDYTVRLWDADSPAGEQLGGPLRGHQHGVMGVAFTPGASCIVSGSGDGTLRIWPNPPTKAPQDALRDKLA